MQKNNRYLILDSINCLPGGLDHKLSTLKDAIVESISLNRILVLRKFTIWPYQNFVYTQNLQNSAETIAASISNNIRTYNNPADALNIDFEKYINLAKTKIYKLQEDGEILEIKTPLRYINEEDFYADMKEMGETLRPQWMAKTGSLVDEFPNSQPRAINNQLLIMENNLPISTEQNNHYQIIVRRTNHDHYRKKEANSFIVSLHPSKEVECLSDYALQSFGTNLTDAKRRFAFYDGATTAEIRNNYQVEFSCKYPLYYACLHVRANDGFHIPNIRYGADRSNLKHIVEQALPKGSIIYIMSDIGDTHYFDFLRKDYTVYQYFDFPRLNALVTTTKNQKIDNAMLYSVEKNILQYAHTKIVRTRANPKLIYTNASHRIPWRYRLSSIYEHLSIPGFQTDPLYRKSLRKTIRYIKRALKSNQYRH